MEVTYYEGPLLTPQTMEPLLLLLEMSKHPVVVSYDNVEGGIAKAYCVGREIAKSGYRFRLGTPGYWVIVKEGKGKSAPP